MKRNTGTRMVNETTHKPPFTQKDLEICNQLIKKCQETKERCDRAGRCLINVDRETATNLEQLKIAELIKREYFPAAQ